MASGDALKRPWSRLGLTLLEVIVMKLIFPWSVELMKKVLYGSGTHRGGTGKFRSSALKLCGKRERVPI